MTWKIRDWDGTFENNKSRILKAPTWVSWPVRKDSESFVFLTRSPLFLQAFGLFALLVQLAARQSPRGFLRDDRGDITPERIARRYNTDPKTTAKAWELLASPDVGWIENANPETPRHEVPDSGTISTPSAALLICNPSSPSSTSDTQPAAAVVSAERVAPKLSDVPPGFAEWWQLYPSENGRKGDKKACVKKWEAEGLEARSVEVVKALKKFVKSSKWKELNGQYIPAPLVWLNRGLYDNPPPSDLIPHTRRMTNAEVLALDKSFGQGPAIEPPRRAIAPQTLPEGGSSNGTQQGGSNGK